MNTGAPRTAVTIPTSVSPGKLIILPIMSEISISIAEPRKERGSVLLISLPKISLIIWGMISPTKPIGPASAVVAPHNSTEESAPMVLVITTLVPRAVAASSPKARLFKYPDINMDMIKPAIRNGLMSIIFSQLALPMLPTCQNLKASITLLFGSIMVLTSEPKTMLTAEPESASFSGVAPSFPILATPYTKTAVTPAPIMASQMY